MHRERRIVVGRENARRFLPLDVALRVLGRRQRGIGGRVDVVRRSGARHHDVRDERERLVLGRRGRDAVREARRGLLRGVRL
jgi:hypothetical protein